MRSLAIACAVTVCLVAAPIASAQLFSWTNFVGQPGGAGNVDGTGSGARFQGTASVAVDSAGNVYVADSNSHTIRKVTPSGVVTTLAGLAGSSGSTDGTGSEARFYLPRGVAVDSAGNVYVADCWNNTIRKVTPSGVVTTLAGLAGFSNTGSTDGTGSGARFYTPIGVVVDSAGNVYVADTNNHTIRKVTPSGVVTTLAGLAGSSGSTDGTGSGARFFQPFGVAVDSAGNVYVADEGNQTIRKVTPSGVVTTLAGLAGSAGSSDGTGSGAKFYYPSGVAVDSAGNVYVADAWNFTIRKVTPAGVVTTLAGQAGYYGYKDGTGSAAKFGNVQSVPMGPTGVAVDSAGNVYVADSGNYTIRKVTPDRVVTTVAGLAGSSGSTDGTGSGARFDRPEGVAVDSAGNVYVADRYNSTIRKVTPSGVVTTLAGLAGAYRSDDGTGSEARFYNPSGVAVDSAGNVYVGDQGNHTIRKVTPGGLVTTLAGLAGYSNSGSTDGTGSGARFSNPRGVAVDSVGNVYVADSGNYTIRKVTPGGVVTTLAGLAGSSGSTDGTGSAARFGGTYTGPGGVAVDSAGNVYVADSFNHTIRKVTPGGVVTTLAGLAGSSGSSDGTGSGARFRLPNGVAVDSAGNVYVADSGNYTIRKVTLGGVVTTIGGTAGVMGSVDGAGGAAQFNLPDCIAVDLAGNLYVADSNNNRISKGMPAGNVTPPTVVISSLIDGQTLAASPVLVAGTAANPGSPSSGVVLVEVRVNGGAWQTASGATNWSASLDLTPGTNQIDARSKDDGGNYSSIVSVNVTYAPGGESDTTPPTPDPSTWAAEPAATGAASISMTATVASDPSGVQYFFHCLTSGGHDSIWQDSPTYEDTGLSPKTTYSYQVKTRDKSANPNEGTYSAAASATTQSQTGTVTPSGSKCGAAGSGNLPIFGMMCLLGLSVMKRLVREP